MRFSDLQVLNDINVLDRSSVFDDILQGRAPKVSVKKRMLNVRKMIREAEIFEAIFPKIYFKLSNLKMEVLL